MGDEAEQAEYLNKINEENAALEAEIARLSALKETKLIGSTAQQTKSVAKVSGGGGGGIKVLDFGSARPLPALIALHARRESSFPVTRHVLCPAMRFREASVRARALAVSQQRARPRRECRHRSGIAVQARAVRPAHAARRIFHGLSAHELRTTPVDDAT